MAAGCALRGGCPTDYVAVSVSGGSFALLLLRAAYPFVIRKGKTRAAGISLVVVQVVGSLNLILSLMLSVDYIKFKRKHSWQSCYTWAVWFEGPLGFGLLMSSRIVQAFQLYHLFVKRRLPPVRSRILFPLILLPWIVGAACIHIKKPMNQRCHMRNQWVIPVVCIHSVYIAALAGLTLAIRHVNFRFHELKDLWRGIIVSTFIVGLWIIAYVFNEMHEDIPWIQVASRFFLLVLASILVLAFFSIPVSQPLLSQLSFSKRNTSDFPTMSQALGILDSGLLRPTTTVPIDVNEPLDKLLLNKRFRQSFMAFADSCLAGESVHFYEEVNELRKIPTDDTVTRIYMARHIIEKYIASGAEMEVNISHRTRQDILSTYDLAEPTLFDRAMIELIQLMKTNLANDYWSSTFFIKFSEESQKPLENNNMWSFAPRLSGIHSYDDPFHQGNMQNRTTSDETLMFGELQLTSLEKSSSPSQTQSRVETVTEL